MKVTDIVRSIETIVHHDGNGAREALREIDQKSPPQPEAMFWEDWILLELAARGFKVVPIEGDEKE